MVSSKYGKWRSSATIKGGIILKKTFEEQMEALENIVNELEKGDLNLDDSVTKFEEGMKLSKDCNKILEQAEKKITILLQEDGNVTEEEFKTED